MRGVSGADRFHGLMFVSRGAIEDLVWSWAYLRDVLDHWQRYQKGLVMEQLYPTISGRCSCGCGNELSGRKKRWASRECSRNAYIRFAIIKGDLKIIRRELWARDEGFCQCCGVFDENWQADHAWPIHNGGGGCELSNLQTLCPSCHQAKTSDQLASQRNLISSQAASSLDISRLYDLGAAS